MPYAPRPTRPIQDTPFRRVSRKQAALASGSWRRWSRERARLRVSRVSYIAAADAGGRAACTFDPRDPWKLPIIVPTNRRRDAERFFAPVRIETARGYNPRRTRADGT